MLVERGDRRHYAFAAAAGAERIDEFRTFGLLLFFFTFCLFDFGFSYAFVAFYPTLYCRRGVVIRIL